MYLKEKIIGMREFGPKIDVTDPCYDKDVWCRINGLKIKKTTYRMSIWKGSELAQEDIDELRDTIQSVYNRGLKQEDIDEELADIRSRVFCIEIKEKGRAFSLNSPKWKEIGTIGVDAGLAGFFPDKPNFSNDEWQKFVDEMYSSKRTEYKNDEYGFYSSSGYGDGGYPVYGIKEGDEYVALKICF